MKDKIEFNPRNLIRHYMRDATNNLRGVAIAYRTPDNKVEYGFALCNTNADKFSKEKGVQIALRRALSDCYQLPAVPEREKMVLDAFEILESRALNYFKDMFEGDVTLKKNLAFD